MTAQPTPALDPAREETRAKDDPLFSGLPGDIDASFEFFPPKNEKMEESLWNAVQELKPLDPHFVSVTYGAGGSTRERTHKTVERIIAEAGLPAAAHLTCVNASKKDTQRIAEKYWEAGVRHIVALRGDMPQEDGTLGPFEPHPDGYNSAEELVHGLKEVADFEISVSAYPEMHPDAQDQQTEIDYLKRKIDAGASRAITQFFFSPNTFFDYLEKTDKAGIDVPIVPGILPITNVAKARLFAGQNGAEFPDWMDDLFEGLDDRPSARKLVAATVAGEMCRRLYAGGIRHYHFYTLNRADLAYSICHLLGMRPKGGQETGQ